MRVKFKPIKSDIPVNICSHRHDALATFTHQTDTRVQTSIYAVELFGFKNNVRLGAFITNYFSGLNTGIYEQEQSGIIRFDNYFPTDYWQNPISGAIEVIPDYHGTTWTNAGVAAFENAVLGEAKNSRTPRHGQQMFNITNGRLGYDYLGEVSGTSNQLELIGVINQQRNWLVANTGRVPSAGSYRNGDNGSRYMQAPFYLGFRNSNPASNPPIANGNTYYGLSENGTPLGFPYVTSYDRDRFIDTDSTFRWWDNWNTGGNTKAASDLFYTTQLTKCITENGWYKDFCHWHSARNNGTITSIDEFLQMFNSTKGNNFVWTCSMGEAYEYLFLRSMVKYVNAIERDGKVSVIVDLVDDFKNQLKRNINQAIDLNCINVPLSVKIDLTGTTLANKAVKSSYGKLIDKGSNVYIVEILFNKKDGFKSVELSEGVNGIYNTIQPTATVSVNGNSLKVSANQPCKMVLFRVAAAGNYYDSLPVERINKLEPEYTFNISSGFDYRIGIINEFGMANLITV